MVLNAGIVGKTYNQSSKRSNMTVQQLMRALMELPSDQKVYVSSDPEGNSFGDLGEVLNYEPLNGKALVIYPTTTILPEEL